MKDVLVQDCRIGSETIKWDLADLFESVEAWETALTEADELADEFATRYRHRIKDLSAPDFAQALKEFEDLIEWIGRAYTYAYLGWSTATTSHEAGAALQRVREAYSRINQKILFFELEWIALDDPSAETLLRSPELQPQLHYLRVRRRLKKYVMSEAEEKILAEKSVTGRSAWNRFFDETLASTRFRLGDSTLTEQEVLAKLYDTDRTTRRDAALSLTEGLQERLRETTFVFNTILCDKASDDHLRGYPNWLASRNLANQVEDETVDRLVNAVTGSFDLVARYYSLKKKLLGLTEIYDYDRYAPLGESATQYRWDDARQTVLQAYGEFHPRMAEIASFFFDRKWIDAAIEPGKRSGAFSHGAVPGAHPYVLMNYTGSSRDVQTLAHELGHGVHQYLARSQGVLQCDTPLTTAETASVFGEMLVFESLLEKESDPRNRLAMLTGKIDDTIATVFRQIAMNRFEDSAHRARRKEGELSSERFSELWFEAQNRMFQGSVILGDHYKIWWSYIPHFIHSPGYVYAYAFGELLVLALFARYREEGPSFADEYLELLAAGGSDWPHVLAGRLGVDLNDSNFWRNGISRIENLIERAEALAAEVTA